MFIQIENILRSSSNSGRYLTEEDIGCLNQKSGMAIKTITEQGAYDVGLPI